MGLVVPTMGLRRQRLCVPFPSGGAESGNMAGCQQRICRAMYVGFKGLRLLDQWYKQTHDKDFVVVVRIPNLSLSPRMIDAHHKGSC